MSFIIPTLRTAFRSNLKTSTKLLGQQYSVPSRPFRRHLPFSVRPYIRGNPCRLPQNGSKIDSTNELAKGPVAPDSTSTNKDALSGDIHAAPGSILSEYAANPQGPAQLEPASEDSGSLKKAEYISSADRKRERITRTLTLGSLFGLLGAGIYLGRPLEEEEQERMGWGTVKSLRIFPV